MSRTFGLALITVLLAPVASVSAGQTLGDVARKEEERRRTVKAGGRTITNRDLQAVPSGMSIPPADQAAGSTPARPETAATAPSKDEAKKGGDGAAGQAQAASGQKDEKAWRSRMAQLRTQLDRDKMLAEALQTRINSLTTDFVNRDDPAQRSVLEADRQKAIDELNRMKKAVVDGNRAIADLEEEARRAGVPPGWLR